MLHNSCEYRRITLHTQFCKSERYHYCFQAFAVFQLQYVPFLVIPRRLSFNIRRFGTPYRFHLHRQVDEGVPKRRLLKLRRRGITQKGTYYRTLTVYDFTIAEFIL